MATPSGTAKGALPGLANTEGTNARYAARTSSLLAWSRKASAKVPQPHGGPEGPDEKADAALAVPYAPDEKVNMPLGYHV